MKIATLNIGHQARRRRVVPHDLLDALLDLQADLIFLTEYVNTLEYEAALGDRWPHVCMSEQVPFNDRGLWSNQVVALSKVPLTKLPGLQSRPDQHAATNFLCVRAAGVTVTGLRAPTYKKAADWHSYWDGLKQHLRGDIVIGDINVDPARRQKRDRVLPQGWKIVTPANGGPSYRSLKNKTSSTVDHALVRPQIEVANVEYRSEFFGNWSLDHCPLVIDVVAPK